MKELFFDFFNTDGYVFEIVFSIFLFTWWIERKGRFVLRFLLILAFLILVSEVTSYLPFMSVFNDSLRTILIFLVCVLGLVFCYKMTTGPALFYGTAGCAVQHFAYKASTTVLVLVWHFFMPDTGISTVMNLGYPILFVVFALFCHFLFGKGLRGEAIHYLTDSPLLLFLLIGMQLATNIFHNLYSYFDTSFALYIIFNLFALLCCLFLLALLSEVVKSENEQRENEVMRQLLHMQKQQMEMSKENIELINIKCHDIKNQIALLGNRVSKEEIRDLERAVSIYDTALRTGNEALDVLLMEKFMLCESKDIRLDCMIEGANLSFMRPSDIYSIFGNAIDNAIEAVDKLKDAEKRYISVKGREDKGMFSIHIENFYEGALSFESGLPETTKQDKRYHGFGMKSIRMITEKYHGYFKVKAENGVFALNILLEI